MAEERLYVKLYDRTDDADATVEFNDEDDGTWFDLNTRKFADQAARVVVIKGAEYRVGDHVQLLDDATKTGSTNVRCIDPAVAPTNTDGNADVDLNKLNFADTAAAARIVLNPNADQSFRLRVRLYDTADQAQELPTLVLYDWQFADKGYVADLNTFYFADKAARVIVDAGPAVQPGDYITLRDKVTDHQGRRVEPGENLNLNDVGDADWAAAVAFFQQ